MRNLLVTLAFASFSLTQTCPSLFAQASPKPIEIENDVPDGPIGELYQRKKSWPTSVTEQLAFGGKILEEGLALLAAHPEASAKSVRGDLLLRRVLMPVAERVYRLQPNDSRRKLLLDIATRVAQSSITDAHQIHGEKVHAAYLAASLNILNHKGVLRVTPREARIIVEDMLKAFPAIKTPGSDELDLTFPGAAHGAALRLASEASLDELVQSIAAAMEAEPTYMRAPGAVAGMVAANCAPIFRMNSLTLDGKPFVMPADTQGKVVVIDYWATWCGPCIASMPHIAKVQAEFADRGVLVVGVNADIPRKDETVDQKRKQVTDFVTSKGYNWTQTFSGAWPDCAVNYGVSKIPVLTVIGKDGRIFDANARGRLEAVLEAAIAKPYPVPIKK